MKKSGILKKYICLFGYFLVPIFFITLYCIMLMSYEDINQSFNELDRTVPEILRRILNYIPRAGEFYQHIAVHNMTLSISFGLDLLFRLLTAAMASALVYFCTFFILKRKPSIKYSDLLVFLGVFLLMMISEVSEVFTYRFSYVHNYILATLITVVFLLPFRLRINSTKIWSIIGAIAVGFLFGISTEIVPLAFLIILVVWLIIKFVKKQLKFSDIWQEYRLQLFSLVGVFLGIIFFYLVGAGLSSRTQGGYAAVYDYVSIFDIFKPGRLLVIYKIWQHAWYNIRYLMFPILMIILFIIVESLLKKKVAKKSKNNVFLHCVVLSFSALYMAASTQIRVLDDMYARYMFFVYVAIFISTLAFIKYLIDIFNVNEKTLKRFAVTLCIISGIAFIDMLVSFVIYRIQVDEQLYKITRNEETKNLMTTEPYSRVTMMPSPIFKFTQMTPFDWGTDGAGAMKFGVGPDSEAIKVFLNE